MQTGETLLDHMQAFGRDDIETVMVDLTSPDGVLWRQGGRATQGKEVFQRPCQEGERRSDVGAILALVGASFLGALTSVALGPFLPMIARDLRTSVPLLGQTATAALLSAAVLGLIVGPLADRYGHRRLLLAWGGYAALGVGLAAFAAAAVVSVRQPAAGERSVPPRSEAD